jgi:hypothetical protein
MFLGYSNARQLKQTFEYQDGKSSGLCFAYNLEKKRERGGSALF